MEDHTNFFYMPLSINISFEIVKIYSGRQVRREKVEKRRIKLRTCHSLKSMTRKYAKLDARRVCHYS